MSLCLSAQALSSIILSCEKKNYLERSSTIFLTNNSTCSINTDSPMGQSAASVRFELTTGGVTPVTAYKAVPIIHSGNSPIMFSRVGITTLALKP